MSQVKNRKKGVDQFFGLLFLAATFCGCAAKPPNHSTGNVDALFGPATAVAQGQGMTEEIQRALRPGAGHKLLERMVGTWVITGERGRNNEPYEEEAEIKWVMAGRWLQAIIREAGAVTEKSIVYLGYDNYRRAYVYFQIGDSYTSPQIRVGEVDVANNRLIFRRHFTIIHRGEEKRLTERMPIQFEEETFSWAAYETIGEEAERKMYHGKFYKKQNSN